MTKYRPQLLLLSLFLFSLLASGCGSSSDDNTTDPTANNNGGSGRVEHQSWNSYRLYRYEAGTWQLVVDLGQATGARPLLNERPVLIIHGLGSNIYSGRLNNLADSLLSNGATSIFGFEYDTLDPISTNSTFLNEAIAYLTADEGGRTFRIVGHSLGALVARSSFESGATFDMAPTGNLVSFVAGPHLGSEVAEDLISDSQTIVDEALAELILNGELTFENSDRRQVEVRGDEAVFQELSLNSNFLNTINFEAANKHPQFQYRTIAGNNRGSDFEAFNRILGTFADDGLVNVESANATVIGPLESQVVPFDHSSIIIEPGPLLVVLDQIGLLP